MTQTNREILEQNQFAQLNLIEALLKAIADLNYSTPTEVQAKTIPLALPTEDGSYQDLMVSSKTGSGKTAAYLLPILNELIKNQLESKEQQGQEFVNQVSQALTNGETTPKKRRRRNPKNSRKVGPTKPLALVLCPTRELAQQVNHDAISLLKYSSNVRVASIIGGTPYNKQVASLQGASIVIATPGRLLDLQRSGQIQLEKVKFLILDEADRMLDLGFSEDLAAIEKLCAQRQQTLMFSATFAPNIQKLATKLMTNPSKIEISNHQQKHVDITQRLMWVDNKKHKRDLLDFWLRSAELEQAIVFASTKAECDQLAIGLQVQGFSAQSLHGDLNQGLRNRRLNALRKGSTQILVATDVAARGIDVPTITHVFNYGLPMKAEDYTHRIGRTGRAGRTGTAVTFAEFRDRLRVFDIERYTSHPFESIVITGLEPKQRFPKDGEGLQSKSHNSAKSKTNGKKKYSKNGSGRSRSRFDEQQHSGEKRNNRHNDDNRFGEKRRTESKDDQRRNDNRFGEKRHSQRKNSSAGNKNRTSSRPR